MELDNLQTLPQTAENGLKQRSLVVKIEDAWLKKEMFWH